MSNDLSDFIVMSFFCIEQFSVLNDALANFYFLQPYAISIHVT